MKEKIYAIVLGDGKNVKRTTLTSYSLHKLIDDFVENDYQTVCIIRAGNMEEKLKQRYYRSKYSTFSKQFKNKKISEEQFRRILDDLKKMKEESITKVEFETKFNEYKKTLTIIPPYNVSDK